MGGQGGEQQLVSVTFFFFFSKKVPKRITVHETLSYFYSFSKPTTLQITNFT